VNVQLSWFGGAHTRGDELIMVEPDSVLFTGDVVQEQGRPLFLLRGLLAQNLAGGARPYGRPAPQNRRARSQPTGRWIADRPGTGADGLPAIAHRRTESRRQTVPQATAILTAEVHDKYPGWTGFNHIDQAVAQGYAGP